MARPRSDRQVALFAGLSLILLCGIYRSDKNFWSMVSTTPETASVILPTASLQHQLDQNSTVHNVSASLQHRLDHNSTVHNIRASLQLDHNSTVHNISASLQLDHNSTVHNVSASLQHRLDHNSTVHNIVATTTTAIDKNLSDALGTIPEKVKNRVRSYMKHPIGTRSHPPNTPGAFLHVGKTAGSTIASVLENACHSFVSKPCPNFRRWADGRKQETYVSATTTYIHTPDFNLMGTNRKYTNFEFYVISLRDPFSKFLSSFTYLHPRNGLVGVKRKKMKLSRCNEFYRCFPTLEQFAQDLGENPSDFEYPHPPEQILSENCTKIARAIVGAKLHGECNEHFYWNTKTILEGIPGWENSRSSHFALKDKDNSTSSSLGISPPPLLVIRTEHLDQDFKNANQVLGDPDPLTMKEAGSASSRVQSVYNVTKDISQVGRRNLCQGLLPEYKAYIQALALALNLSDRDRQASLELAQTNCPDLEFLFQKDLMTMMMQQRR